MSVSESARSQRPPGDHRATSTTAHAPSRSSRSERLSSGRAVARHYEGVFLDTEVFVRENLNFQSHRLELLRRHIEARPPEPAREAEGCLVQPQHPPMGGSPCR